MAGFVTIQASSVHTVKDMGREQVVKYYPKDLKRKMYMAVCTSTLTWKGKEAQSPSLIQEKSTSLYS